MLKYLAPPVAVFIAVVGVAFVLSDYVYEEKWGGVKDYKDATFTIDGIPVTLVDGRAETEAAPGSASRIVTEHFGNDAIGDLSNDGVPDVAFIVTQTGGGSGTFYFVVAALRSPAGKYIGTNGIFLGDRIAPQSTEIRSWHDMPTYRSGPRTDSVLIVNYADRRPDEPISAQPSVGVSRSFKVADQQLVEE